jgi:hypothetical protein
MKKLLITLVFCGISAWAKTQNNLVPNPSFENPLNCPNGGGVQISDCPNWINYSVTPDYYHTCYGTIPGNFVGYQFPRTGNGMMGVMTWANPSHKDYREYIGAQLLNPLVVGQKYYISFYINYGAMYSPWENVASNKLGLRFTKLAAATNSFALITNFSHVRTDSIYKDTLNWLRVSGSFIADSVYTHVVIGNFYDDAHTDTALVHGYSGVKVSYYFIDDVCVSTNSLSCSLITDLADRTGPPAIKVSPNPMTESAMLSFENSRKEKCTLYLYNNQGTIIRTVNNISGDKVEIKRDGISSGLYFYKVQTGDRVIDFGKIVME